MRKSSNCDLDIGVHWIQGVINNVKTDDFFKFCKKLLAFHRNDSFKWSQTPTRMGKVFDNSAISLGGLRVGYSESEGTVSGFFLIPGSYLDALSFEDQLNVLRFCFDWEVKITRIDIAFNDFQKRLTPQKLDCWAKENYLRGFRTHSSIREDFRVVGRENVSLGATKTFGSRSSQKYLRVYEALPIHGVDAVRWELELRDDRARATAHFLLNSDDASQELCELICGAIDFVVNDGGRLDRSEQLEEWEEFVCYVGGASKIRISKAPTPLEKKIDWLFRQCSRTLAIAKRRYGAYIVRELLEIGNQKLSFFDEELIKYAMSSS